MLPLQNLIKQAAEAETGAWLNHGLGPLKWIFQFLQLVPDTIANKASTGAKKKNDSAGAKSGRIILVNLILVLQVMDLLLQKQGGHSFLPPPKICRAERIAPDKHLGRVSEKMF